MIHSLYQPSDSNHNIVYSFKQFFFQRQKFSKDEEYQLSYRGFDWTRKLKCHTRNKDTSMLLSTIFPAPGLALL